MTQTEASSEARQDLILRLRRIEGQARGVQRMLEENRDCADIVSQLASMRAAVYSAGVFLLKHYAKECAAKEHVSGTDKPIEELIDLMLRVS
jgi:DNA-binding FrmR family transcriptional regulator